MLQTPDRSESRLKRPLSQSRKFSSCKGSAANAFAPATIDLNGAGYAYVVTGVIAEMPWVSCRGWWRAHTIQKKPLAAAASDTVSSTVSSGDITGFVSLDLKVNVKTAGDGAIIINRTSSLPSLAAPRVVSAECTAARGPTA